MTLVAWCLARSQLRIWARNCVRDSLGWLLGDDASGSQTLDVFCACAFARHRFPVAQQETLAAGPGAAARALIISRCRFRRCDWTRGRQNLHSKPLGEIQ